MDRYGTAARRAKVALNIEITLNIEIDRLSSQ